MSHVSNQAWKKLNKSLEDLGVNLDKIQEVFCLGSGKGGQKINKTSSAVQLRYEAYFCESSRYRQRDMNRYDVRKKLLVQLQRGAGIETADSRALNRKIKQKKRRRRRSKQSL